MYLCIKIIALMLNLNIENITLSSSLPNRFTIEQVDDVVTCWVEMNGVRLYTTTLSAKDHTAIFYDLRTLVEDYMKAHNLTVGTFLFEADYGQGGECVDDITIVYAPFAHGMDSDIEFLESHFLTSRRNYSVPRGCPINLVFFASDREQFTVMVDCVFRKNGELNPCYYEERIRQERYAAKYSFCMESEYVTRMCYEVDGDEMGELMSATATVGNRSITIYYTDDKPIITFGFRNIFNVLEYAHVIGKEVLKTDISRKEASCQGITSFYDESIEQKHHIETCHLTADEAKWFNEFLASQDIFVTVQPEEYQIRVVITDITSEINYSPSEQTRMKFAWKFAENREWRSIEQPVQIFTNRFNPAFQ